MEINGKKITGLKDLSSRNQIQVIYEDTTTQDITKDSGGYIWRAVEEAINSGMTIDPEYTKSELDKKALDKYISDAKSMLASIDEKSIRWIKFGVFLKDDAEWLQLYNDLTSAINSTTVKTLPDYPRNTDGSIRYPAGT